MLMNLYQHWLNCDLNHHEYLPDETVALGAPCARSEAGCSAYCKAQPSRPRWSRVAEAALPACCYVLRVWGTYSCYYLQKHTGR